jgi:membrane fusion protein, heavy metal efflux system
MNNTIALMLTVALTLAGCSRHDHDAKGTHDKAGAEQTAGEHGHAHGGALSRTHYTEATELFVEFPKLVKGDEAAFAAHVTRLNDFSALKEGQVSVTLSGGGHPDEIVRTGVSANAGIFRPVLKPRYSGKRRLAFHVQAPGLTATHDIGEIEVYDNTKAAEAAGSPASTDAGIKYTKEQQWKTEFATAPVAERTLRESVSANAVLRPRPAGEAHVAAPGAGLLRAGPKGFPQVGMEVQAGQVVAFLLPRMGGESDAAALDLAVARARIQTEHARHDRERLEALYAAEAVAEKRVRDAREHEDIARAELVAAQRRAATYSGSSGGIPLKTPIAGTVVAVTASPGAAVTDGQSIVHIADLGRIVLEARLPESEVARVSTPTGAVFRLDGDERLVVLEAGKNARLIAFGGLVDRDTRTVPVIFEFDNPGRRLRAGTNVRAHVYTGRVTNAPAIPASSLVDDAGQPVVFVQLGGESFERRVVQPGLRDGDWIAITRGLKAGERIVTKGAYDVRLSAAAPAAVGHGHAH